MSVCVTTPRQTVYSTPINVQTITNTVTNVITNPGAEFTQTLYSTSCLPTDNGPATDNGPNTVTAVRGRIMRRQDCPNGSVVDTSYIIYSGTPSFSTTVQVVLDYVTNRGAPVPVETQYGTSCSNNGGTSPTQAVSSGAPQQTTITVTPSPTPTTGGTLTLSTPTPTQTSDNVVVGHKSTKTAAIAGGAAAGVVCLALAVGAIFYFKFFKAGAAGKGGHHGGEKAEIDWPFSGGGGSGVEASGAGAGGGGGAGIDTSPVAGGGYAGTAPPTTGLESQYVTNLPPGATVPAHSAYPVIVPVGAKQKESGQPEMVNTISTPWIDPAQQQSPYYPQQPGQQQQPWGSSAPSSSQYSPTGPGYNNGQYPTDSRATSPAQYQQQLYNDPRMSQAGYPVDPRASMLSSQSSMDYNRASYLPYINEHGAPQPGPSVASTPAPPSSVTETSTAPFGKHAEAAASSSAAGPSDHELPPPSYEESGPSTRPFTPQDAKGRQ